MSAEVLQDFNIFTISFISIAFFLFFHKLFLRFGLPNSCECQNSFICYFLSRVPKESLKCLLNTLNYIFAYASLIEGQKPWQFLRFVAANSGSASKPLCCFRDWRIGKSYAKYTGINSACIPSAQDICLSSPCCLCSLMLQSSHLFQFYLIFLIVPRGKTRHI